MNTDRACAQINGLIIFLAPISTAVMWQDCSHELSCFVMIGWSYTFSNIFKFSVHLVVLHKRTRFPIWILRLNTPHQQSCLWHAFSCSKNRDFCCVFLFRTRSSCFSRKNEFIFGFTFLTPCCYFASHPKRYISRLGTISWGRANLRDGWSHDLRPQKGRRCLRKSLEISAGSPAWNSHKQFVGRDL